MALYLKWIWPWIWRIRSRLSPKKLATDSLIPDFRLSDLDGKSYRLSGVFPEKGAVLWMTNLCEGCKARIPFLNGLKEQYGDRFGFFAISILGANHAKPLEIQSRTPLQFPLLLDPADWVGRKLGLEHAADACPLFNLLVLDTKGLIRFKAHLSAIPEDSLRKALDP